MSRAVALALALCALPTAAGAQGLTDSDWVVIEPSVGASYTNILAFDNSGLLPGVNNSSSFGPMYGLTAGTRLSIVTLAARLDFSRYDAYDIGTLGARVQVHLPLPVVKPFARIGGGWAWLGSLNPASAMWTCSPGSASNECPSINGWNLNVGAGVDFSVQRWLTVGAGLDFYLLNLNRASSPTQVAFMRTGDSMGFQLALSAQAALRF